MDAVYSLFSFWTLISRYSHRYILNYTKITLVKTELDVSSRLEAYRILGNHLSEDRNGRGFKA